MKFRRFLYDWIQFHKLQILSFCGHNMKFVRWFYIEKHFLQHSTGTDTQCKTLSADRFLKYHPDIKTAKNMTTPTTKTWMLWKYLHFFLQKQQARKILLLFISNPSKWKSRSKSIKKKLRLLFFYALLEDAFLEHKNENYFVTFPLQVHY